MLNRRYAPAVALACLVSLTGSLPLHAQLTDRAELVKNPKYAAKDVKPTFKKITAEELRAAVKVVSGRSSALFGFNNPAVEVHLPRIDNSVYVVDTWETPKLFDAKGRVIGFEKEQGLYDHRSFSTEMRFASGGEKPPVYAKAVGSMRITYPLAMSTISIRKSEAAKAAEHGVVIDGPYVKVYAEQVAEASFGNDIEAVRAYDKAGKRLERVAGYSSSGFDDRGNYQQWAWHGDVARADVDVILERAGLTIDYEMPPAPELPLSKAGAMSSAPATLEETPGGKFTLTPFRVIPPAALGGWGSYSAEQAREALAANYDVREASFDALMRAATEGETDVIRLCLVAGVDPNGTSAGMTPLILAASFGHFEAAKVLVLAGADVNARDETNSTAILRAAGLCDATELIGLLIKAKADVNVKANGGATPLTMANAVQCSENAKLIKAAGGK
ncbi:MAG: ankyrin repeat domain-containing protein [Thermoanaerobaculia bacterium]|nr:ankyrin repeat domain-containing protein [Thermoanaerobaculia bacterium]